MFMLLPIVVALAAADPAPAASSAPRPTPLTEIGRVRALPACVPIVAHANGAITQALDNDRTLAVLTTNLHNTNFDKLNVVQRKNAIDALMKHAEAMRIAASAGDAEVKKLREYAVNSPDPKRKEELKTFADALGGALYRQKKAAVELMRDVSILQGREDNAEARGLMRAANRVPSYPNAQAAANTGAIMPGVPDSYNKQFQGIGDVLDDLTKGIQLDEGTAADHSIAATSGC
ncbi:MAG: hypothetical protein QOF71_2259 [Candidatus Eremiobacteraeota bacterium]|jgi:hypothetical protein|nr:hypothetical protein [Candidatus Eremiobacteraeota bacterium]